MTKTLDVLNPTYQRCNYLIKNRDFLKGELDKTPENSKPRVMILDSGSTDGTVEAVRKRSCGNQDEKRRLLEKKGSSGLLVAL